MQGSSRCKQSSWVICVRFSSGNRGRGSNSVSARGLYSRGSSSCQLNLLNFQLGNPLLTFYKLVLLVADNPIALRYRGLSSLFLGVFLNAGRLKFSFQVQHVLFAVAQVNKLTVQLSCKAGRELFHCLCGCRRVRAVYSGQAVARTYRQELRNVTVRAGTGNRCT